MSLSKFVQSTFPLLTCALLQIACVGAPEQDIEGDELPDLPLDEEGGAIDTVDLTAGGSISGNIVTCSSKNRGPGTIISSESWATGVELRHPKTGAIMWYTWALHNVDLAPGASVSFEFDAGQASWRSPSASYLVYPPEAVGSFAGYRVDCTANAGAILPSSSPSGMYLQPPFIPESSYSNNRRIVQHK